MGQAAGTCDFRQVQELLLQSEKFQNLWDHQHFFWYYVDGAMYRSRKPTKSLIFFAQQVYQLDERLFAHSDTMSAECGDSFLTLLHRAANVSAYLENEGYCILFADRFLARSKASTPAVG